MKNSYFREIVKTTDSTAQITNYSKGNREITWENSQKLFKRNKYCNVVKTGITAAAGPCLSSTFTINNRNFIMVILKTTSMEMRFVQTMSIFKFIVDIYEVDKEKKEEISKELIYQPDQENIIEKKYLKKGWKITSANDLISTHEFDDDDKYQSDEDDIGFDDDEDDIIGSQNNSQNALSINSIHKLSDKVNTNDKVNKISQNFVQKNHTELNQNLYYILKKVLLNNQHQILKNQLISLKRFLTQQFISYFNYHLFISFNLQISFQINISETFTQLNQYFFRLKIYKIHLLIIIIQ